MQILRKLFDTDTDTGKGNVQAFVFFITGIVVLMICVYLYTVAMMLTNMLVYKNCSGVIG